MAADPRERSGHPVAVTARGGDAARPSRRPRLPAARPRVVHLGRRPRAGEAARGNSRVSARSHRTDAPMALIKIPERQQTISGTEEVAAFLARYGISHERWESAPRVSPDATADAVLAAYADKVDELKARGGYTTADVI